MCGIYGSTIYYSDEVVREKLARVNFRGPDHTGFERSRQVILGHNRLAIIDLDHRSDQPFSYRHLKIVFNGEIYNYRAIRAQLTVFGYTFYTNSDTEVVAAAYLKFGKHCVEHFNGMFAFVIYDPVADQLFGARDRLGKKPFYYALDSGGFEFASQPSQISIGRRLTYDEQAINEYFIWGYVPEPRSAWNEIKKLPAGYIFTYNLTTRSFEEKKYWDLDTNVDNYYTGTYNKAKSDLKALLTHAVDIRMHADVKLGVFLSGGIDSSLIASLAVKNSSRVNTFCIRFDEKDYDESAFAEKIANHLKTNHHTITCRAEEGMSLIENFGKYYDEPFADSSAIPTLLLSKYTKNYVTVTLSGDGGDESFLGYARYRWLNTANKLFKYPVVARMLLSGALGISSNYRHKLIATGLRCKNIESLYALMLGGLEYSWLEQPRLGLEVPFMDYFSQPGRSFLQRMSSFDVKTYLNGDINTKVDRASMAFAIEARAPMMDHRIVSFAQRLPDSYKFHRGIQKRILKDILYEHVPQHFFNRPKAGFTVPLRHWFRNELKDYVQDRLSLSNLNNIPGINSSKVALMIKDHISGKQNKFPQIWKLLVMTQWLENQKINTSTVYQTA
ncbi:asparagine synthase (glutamine-hydrolyzing) [Mucilaginibacter sp. UR6-11]|uniref:asparagine synthase (glutamine-hydrolyzing) n=1 Tax=Mucilaginibacter sp. UR6-11 TaxID=1435644 RepID=UPI001E5F9016|nr:asparagine synthase (glutamine-hydrolyzing) [Mucilaginibacter sp. UR6-11]MCC8426369.1 asparagine synthase (glutamine-hydrolyzing) [Mucilaginibacter sp. UR6-11]